MRLILVKSIVRVVTDLSRELPHPRLLIHPRNIQSQWTFLRVSRPHPPALQPVVYAEYGVSWCH
jgi:hypothetical protein